MTTPVHLIPAGLDFSGLAAICEGLDLQTDIHAEERQRAEDYHQAELERTREATALAAPLLPMEHAAKLVPMRSLGSRARFDRTRARRVRQRLLARRRARKAVAR